VVAVPSLLESQAGEQERTTLSSGPVGVVVATDAGAPAKSELRALPMRREPVNPGKLERNPYMRR
jgi:hypothetical protein